MTDKHNEPLETQTTGREVPGESHTPGPWVVSPKKQGPNCHKVGTGVDGWLGIASVFGDTHEESLANAHLIKAAPTMLAALLEVRGIMSSELGWQQYLTNFASVEAAIAEAHGAKA